VLVRATHMHLQDLVKMARVENVSAKKWECTRRERSVLPASSVPLYLAACHNLALKIRRLRGTLPRAWQSAGGYDVQHSLAGCS